MKFSIIVPVYNAERYLKECIESVLNQTYQNYELILVNDGSEDDSGSICEQYRKDNPNKVKVIHKVNNGSLSARCCGIANAAGDFCVFTDSDDYIEKNLLEMLEKYLSRDKNLDVLMYSFYYYEDGQQLKRKQIVAPNEFVWNYKNKQELYEKLLFTVDITSMCTKAIRTSILKADKTDYTQYYGKNIAEDLLQTLYPLTIAEKIMFIEQPLYAYRSNNESVSHSFHPNTIAKRNTLHVYEKLQEYLLIWKIDSAEIRQKLEARWFHETMYLFEKYYESACTKEMRQAVLNFEWSDMLPSKKINLENKFINSSYKNLYLFWQKKKTDRIRGYFFRKKCYRKLREWKRRIVK